MNFSERKEFSLGLDLIFSRVYCEKIKNYGF